MVASGLMEPKCGIDDTIVPITANRRLVGTIGHTQHQQMTGLTNTIITAEDVIMILISLSKTRTIKSPLRWTRQSTKEWQMKLGRLTGW
jgi:hypothetical protein